MILPNFKLWIGVVENRADPENLGRCKVRVLGYHTANTTTLATEDLPWASVMMPVTSPSISGVGETPALLPGSVVVGFWADGDDEQSPVIIGTLPGIPTERQDSKEVGFSDPNGKYPRMAEDAGYNTLNEPDLSRLARGASAEKHASLIEKRRTREEEILTAKAYEVSSVGSKIAGASYESGKWEEPHPRFGSTATGSYTPDGAVPSFDKGVTSVYPLNKVTETESGHVFEVDDTPNNGRIHEYHNSGTFYEIQHDGTKVTKVVGDDYEIVIGGKNVSISGGCNVTVKGDCKLRVDGDMYEEIKGNKFTFIGGDHHTKLVGNQLTEVGSGYSLNVKKDFATRIGGFRSVTCVGRDSLAVGGGQDITVNKNVDISVVGNETHNIVGSYNSSTLLNTTHTAVGTYRATGTNMSLMGIQQQKLVGVAAQLLETGGIQTINATGYQNTTAGARTITTGITQHNGLLSVTPLVVGTQVKTMLGTGLDSHKHIASGSPTSPPIPGT